MAKKRGGSRPGAGRKPDLTAEQREEVARVYHQRKLAWATANAMSRDPNLRKRREHDKEMRTLAETHAVPAEARTDDSVIWYHRRLHPRMEKLQAKIDRLPNKLSKPPKQRAKGAKPYYPRSCQRVWDHRANGCPLHQ